MHTDGKLWTPVCRKRRLSGRSASNFRLAGRGSSEHGLSWFCVSSHGKKCISECFIVAFVLLDQPLFPHQQNNSVITLLRLVFNLGRKKLLLKVFNFIEHVTFWTMILGHRCDSARGMFSAWLSTAQTATNPGAFIRTRQAPSQGGMSSSVANVGCPSLPGTRGDLGI